MGYHHGVPQLESGVLLALAASTVDAADPGRVDPGPLQALGIVADRDLGGVAPPDVDGALVHFQPVPLDHEVEDLEDALPCVVLDVLEEDRTNPEAYPLRRGGEPGPGAEEGRRALLVLKVWGRSSHLIAQDELGRLLRSEAAQGDAQSELVCKGKWHFGIFTLFVYAGRYQWTAQQAGRTEEM